MLPKISSSHLLTHIKKNAHSFCPRTKQVLYHLVQFSPWLPEGNLGIFNRNTEQCLCLPCPPQIWLSPNDAFPPRSSSLPNSASLPSADLSCAGLSLVFSLRRGWNASLSQPASRGGTCAATWCSRPAAAVGKARSSIEKQAQRDG